MTKKILVTGAKGQLGSALRQRAPQYPDSQFTFVDHQELDLADPIAIEHYFSKHTFDVVINCAAYTAVDQAESDKEQADKVNHQAVKLLAQQVKQQHAILIHISTDYVFSGCHYRPYVETDPVEPQGVYGKTKWLGEQAIQQIQTAGCIIRTSWVYAENGQNFVQTMLRLGKARDSLNVIFDQVGTPTYAGDLADAILTMLSAGQFQADQMVPVYHFSNEGVCSWYDFAKAIFELADVQCTVTPIETKDYPTPATRPHYSLLNKHKIKQAFGLTIPHWKSSLSTCLQNIANQSA